MDCIACGRDSNKQDRSPGNFCRHCGHPFATNPEVDQITDRLIKNAVEAVSGDGTFQYLRAHLSYEIVRRLKRKIKFRMGFEIFLFFLALIFLVGSAFHYWSLAMTFGLIVVLFIEVRSLLGEASIHDPVIRRYHSINPLENCIDINATNATAPETDTAPDIGAASFDRILICDRDSYVDFFLANHFHIHYACPVLGAGGYPEGVFDFLIERVKQNAELDVFVLHDYSPDGLGLLAHVRHDSRFFGGSTKVDVIDLGLGESHQALFRLMRRTVSQGVGGNAVQRAPSAHTKMMMGAELTVIRPNKIIQLVANAMAQKGPIDPRRDGVWDNYWNHGSG